ncbi:uncharacterized protein CcaverHIS019_0404180 [Cutaneotrichosporon cavernicola]|uniref:Uncharacterized protein n=1 Tax=Cutaneotrichosporon cavernicola TaxID=279322 RepID=A0AA48L456_9TREE|nr:uncharacterized protein CcaverHIS019_0404180 [Cutaneotrichosporon cavernicola]BEI91598.1 hypothetical protein CcaverHIS019_0404180 [Cutaneotrichosporon cavernicola]
MSMLRYLSPGRGRAEGSNSSSTSPLLADAPSLKLHVMNWGVLILPAPDHAGDPRHDPILHGELDVRVSGPRRCKRIRVGLRSIIRLDMGGGRKIEEDVLFERKVEIIGASTDGIWLAPGSQRGSNSRAPSPSRARRSLWDIPSMPPSGAVTPIGGGAPAAPLALAGALANLSLENGHASPTVASANSNSNQNPTSRPGSGSASPSSPIEPHQPINPALLASEYSFSLTRQEVPYLPRIPSYEDTNFTDHASQTPWVMGKHRAKKHIMIVYNPNPLATTNELHDRANGHVRGLGEWEMLLVSDVWTICALMNLQFNVTGIPASTTIFAVRLALAQSWAIISPRDDQAANHLTGTRSFAIFESGKRPPVGHHYPDKHFHAIWRGTDAGGKDKPMANDGGSLHLAATVRLPTDEHVRPTTLPGVVTPITVTHNLVLEVFFSVWGEDDRGEPMKVPGPGGLRLLRVSRPITLPSCALIPEVIDLPAYEEHQRDAIAPDEDSIELLQRGMKGAGPLGDPGWALCACGRKLEDMEARMRAAVIQEVTGNNFDPATSEKVAAERRGRQERLDSY